MVNLFPFGIKRPKENRTDGLSAEAQLLSIHVNLLLPEEQALPLMH